jgi:hypothetical protein
MKAGFLVDFGEDGSGLFMKYLRRGSGHYIDVGASELIAEGKIKLKSPFRLLAISRPRIGNKDQTTGLSINRGPSFHLRSQKNCCRQGNDAYKRTEGKR